MIIPQQHPFFLLFSFFGSFSNFLFGVGSAALFLIDEIDPGRDDLSLYLKCSM